MNKKIILALLYLLLIACSQEAIHQVSTIKCEANTVEIEKLHENHSALEQIIHQYVKKGTLPSLAVWVTSKEKGNFLFSEGLADLQSQVSLDFCHQFRVASLTKTLLATAILQLVEEGQLQLDDQVSDFLTPEVYADIKRTEKASIASLLNHTSGIANYDNNPNFPLAILDEPGKPLTIEDRLDLARNQGATPDWVMEKYGPSYSNTNYLLLQLILEAITQQSYEDYLIRMIFEVLDLKHSTFSTLEPFPEYLVPGYCGFYDDETLIDVSPYDANRFSGDGAWITTIEDLSLFFTALLDGKILTFSTLDLMRTQQLGLQTKTVSSLKGIGHDGRAIGYSAEMWYFPEVALKIILLTNQGRISENQPSMQQWEELIEALVIAAK